MSHTPNLLPKSGELSNHVAYSSYLAEISNGNNGSLAVSNFCFVAQPFDNGKYDKRYKDTFAPAIRAAGYQPYRMDLDPTVQNPMAEIDQKMKACSAFFVEITEDNPNVWFEFGLAVAYNKPLCIVCSKERKTKFPFDIQQRSIIHYDWESKSDFEKLSSQIIERLKAASASATPTTQRKNASLALVTTFFQSEISDHMYEAVDELLYELYISQLKKGVLRTKFDINFTYDFSKLQEGYVVENSIWNISVANVTNRPVEHQVVISEITNRGTVSEIHTAISNRNPELVLLEDLVIEKPDLHGRKIAKVLLKPFQQLDFVVNYIQKWPVNSDDFLIHNAVTSRDPGQNCQIMFHLPPEYNVRMTKEGDIKTSLINGVHSARFKSLFAGELFEYRIEKSKNGT